MTLLLSIYHPHQGSIDHSLSKVIPITKDLREEDIVISDTGNKYALQTICSGETVYSEEKCGMDCGESCAHVSKYYTFQALHSSHMPGCSFFELTEGDEIIGTSR